MTIAFQEIPGPPCLRIVPGHHAGPTLVVDAARHQHRIVEDVTLEGEHTLLLTLDGGDRAVVRNHIATEVAALWPHRAGPVTWNPPARLLGIPLREPVEGCAYYHVTEGPYTPCDEVAAGAEADTGTTDFDALADATLGDLRTIDVDTDAAAHDAPGRVDA